MGVRIINADVFDGLAQLEDESVHCVVTSPPYWGLRDYGVDGQLGMEPTLAEHIEIMVDVFREVNRVLRKDGTLWLNYGDCYAGTHVTYNGKQPKWQHGNNETQEVNRVLGKADNFKTKDLVMVPNRLAIALQDDGWWVRSEIIWHKPNPMPESITDRPATSHEKIWLLSKSQRYFYDAVAVRTASNWDPDNTKMPDGWDTGPGAHGSVHRNGREKGARTSDKQRGHYRRHAGFNDRWDSMSREQQQANGANLRNVWTVPTKPFSEAHFATFPPKLIEPCIKAGCPEGGTVLDPFAGAGTTGLVADRLGRNAILIELNPDYAEMARNRIYQDAPMFAEVSP